MLAIPFPHIKFVGIIFLTGATPMTSTKHGSCIRGDSPDENLQGGNNPHPRLWTFSNLLVKSNYKILISNFSS